MKARRVSVIGAENYHHIFLRTDSYSLKDLEGTSIELRPCRYATTFVGSYTPFRGYIEGRQTPLNTTLRSCAKPYFHERDTNSSYKIKPQLPLHPTSTSPFQTIFTNPFQRTYTQVTQQQICQ